MVVNPRRRRRARPKKHRKARARRKHNPFMSAARVHRRGRRRGRRRNPSVLGIRMPKLGGLDLVGGAMVAAGVIGSEILAGHTAHLVPIPQVQTGLGRVAFKGVAGVGAIMLLRRFVGPKVAAQLGIGVTAGVALDLYQMYLAPHVAAAMGGYAYDQVGGMGNTYSLGAASDTDAGESMNRRGLPEAFQPAWAQAD